MRCFLPCFSSYSSSSSPSSTNTCTSLQDCYGLPQMCDLIVW